MSKLGSMLSLVFSLPLFLASTCFAFPFANLQTLDGHYVLSEADQRHNFCRLLSEMTVTSKAHEVQIELKAQDFDGRPADISETIADVNTLKNTETHYINGIGYSHNIFWNSELKEQESIWILGLIPAPYQNRRTILRIVDDQQIVYGFSRFGSTTCTFIRN